MLKRSLGAISAATRGITISSISNASPHVVTLGALHGIPSLAQNPNRSLRRFGIFGCTGGTSANGIWDLRSTGTNTFALEGSQTNGAVTVTNAVIAAIMDTMPFMKGHSAVAMAVNIADTAPADLTFAVMGNKSDATDAEILASDSTTLATYFEDCVSDVAWSVPGSTTDGISEFRNITLRRWMYLNMSTLANASGIEVVLLI